MPTLEEINQMSRSEQVFLNVASYVSIYPASIIDRVHVDLKENTYCIRIFYVNTKSDKQFIHTFNFYRLAESREAEKFIQLLKENFGSISVTGDPII